MIILHIAMISQKIIVNRNKKIQVPSPPLAIFEHTYLAQISPWWIPSSSSKFRLSPNLSNFRWGERLNYREHFLWCTYMYLYFKFFLCFMVTRIVPEDFDSPRDQTQGLILITICATPYWPSIYFKPHKGCLFFSVLFSLDMQIMYIRY